MAVVPLGNGAQAADAASGQKWFTPKAEAPAPQPQPRPRPAPRRRAVPVPVAAEEDDGPSPEEMGPQAPPLLPLPPVPTVAAIPKEAPPPTAVIGIISIQGVMQLSSAAQEIQQVLGARRDKLAQAVHKEEGAWRAEQRKLQMQARSLTADQIQLRERHLQERRARDQRDFGNQARIIQEAYQVAFHQIERVLEEPNGIIARVSAAHSMNLVFHAEQVVLHVAGQDITQEVANHLNQVMPHVAIPAEGVDPEALARSGKVPTTADEEARPMPPGTQQNHPAKPAKK
ncbi:OmpH family outer membrane protein [Formicincola oecophyllae]|uniref:OmpH family outer membrane protein n=2 Tax=Formicincola oecophyllae TaxID=2558361 RepID=A0A4Y6UAC1_9PROT|nr:OmpH family outer membrane protein [Formicincola oecophyllae]